MAKARNLIYRGYALFYLEKAVSSYKSGNRIDGKGFLE